MSSQCDKPTGGSAPLIAFVGPLPPPLGGFSAITAEVLKRIHRVAEVRRYDATPRGARWRSAVSALCLMGLLLRGRPRALYVALSGGYRKLLDGAFIACARAGRVPVYVHHHSFAYLDRRRWDARWVLRLSRGATHFVLCRRMADLLRRVYRIPESASQVLSNAAFVEACEGTSRARGVLTLGFLSNITREKGVFTFINIVGAARARGMNVRGLIAGPVHATIQAEFFAALQQDMAIEYCGPVYAQAKREFFANVDLLLFPTQYVNEAEPVTIWEALASAVPVLAIARGCIAAQLDAGAGHAWPDRAAFESGALDWLRDCLATPELLAAMRLRARAVHADRHREGLEALGAAVHMMTGRGAAHGR